MIYERHVYKAHEHWRYWVQIVENGAGRRAYAVYREMPLTIPAERLKVYDEYVDAEAFVDKWWSDRRE